MQRMSAVGDLDLIRKRQVAFSNRGISLRYRSKGSTGATHAKPGGRLRQGHSGAVDRFCSNRLITRRKIGRMEAIPTELTTLQAALAAALADASSARTEAAAAKAELARLTAITSSTEALIAHMKLEILKLRRELYGQRSERKARLLEQLELQLEELEATATEDELGAEQTAPPTVVVRTVVRRHSGRKPFPAHLPRERVVIDAPKTCGCCGSARLAKLGEDITETLEVIPRQWKVIRATVREKFTCRDCEQITQPPAPFHPPHVAGLAPAFWP